MTKQTNNVARLLQLRQGDVQIQQVAKLPAGCKEVPSEGGRIVLAHGEVTGHAHAIYDWRSARAAVEEGCAAAQQSATEALHPGAADEIAEAAIARAQSKARLLVAPDGERYLEVTEAVTLRHEEHTQHTIPPGIYHLPKQMEYTPTELRRVAD